MRILIRCFEGLVAVALFGALLGLGCGGMVSYRSASFRYFEIPAPDDPWSPKIEGWQSRERAQRVADPRASAPGSVAEPGELLQVGGERSSLHELRLNYEAFRTRQKRTLARELARWIQEQAQEHYIPDGPLDHWATLAETLQTDGDDCDGLELLVFHLLRDLGFARNEIYRAVVRRPADGQHHMVTLWFEDPTDPWVIDPTGAMTRGMPHMSEVVGWVPLKVFSDTEEYTVRVSHKQLP